MAPLLWLLLVGGGVLCLLGGTALLAVALGTPTEVDQ